MKMYAKKRVMTIVKKIFAILTISIAVICCFCSCGISSNGADKLAITSGKVEKASATANNKIGTQNNKDIYKIYREGSKYLNEYADISNVRSLILIEQRKGSKSYANLLLFKKGEDNKWNEIMKCDAFCGINGIDKIKEGDKKTPTGDFGITMAFGIKEKPDTILEYQKVNDTMYCCGDKEFYNQIIDIKNLKHVCSSNSEHLIKYQPQYNYALFLDYNIERTYGKGSAIFLHCAGKYDYTLGCISISETDMLKVLKFIDSKVRICIYPYVDSEVQNEKY